jgi:hypothetical protein
MEICTCVSIYLITADPFELTDCSIPRFSEDRLCSPGWPLLGVPIIHFGPILTENYTHLRRNLSSTPLDCHILSDKPARAVTEI